MGLALKPPDIGLPADLNLKLRASLGSRHVRELARQAPTSHPNAAPGPNLDIGTTHIASGVIPPLRARRRPPAARSGLAMDR